MEASKDASEADSSRLNPADLYVVGTKLSCRWRDGRFYKSEVIDKRNNAATGLPEYYIHYLDFNKRLDEWVGADRLALGNPEAENADESNPVEKNEPEPPRKMTRNMKRKYEEENHIPKSFEDMDATTAELEKIHEENTKMKNINTIQLGKYFMEAWYCSPFPEEYSKVPHLYICEFCLKYMKLKKTYDAHKVQCKVRHPPGDEIYRDGNISVYEVFGSKQKLYCQNVCLLSKLFLDHKTLYYDVDHFIFYIMTEYDSDGSHIAGYFSKERFSSEDYNLACIMVLPCHQRKGYGKFLISLSIIIATVAFDSLMNEFNLKITNERVLPTELLSVHILHKGYELSRREGKVGSPEKPLSDLGQLSYRSYWTQVLLDILHLHSGTLTIKEMSLMTAMKIEDIVSTLQSLNLIRYWKGQHIISMTPKIVEEHLKQSAKIKLHFNPDSLSWIPIEVKPVKRK